MYGDCRAVGWGQGWNETGQYSTLRVAVRVLSALKDENPLASFDVIMI